jgi:beta-lactamase class A
MNIVARPLLLALLALLAVGSAGAPVQAAHDWTDVLQSRLERIDAGFAGDLGVYVLDLDGGRELSWRGDEVWYLASGIKVLVAIGVLREVEEGRMALDTRLELAAADFVDGAGRTNHHRAGERLTVAFLLEQMIVASDNTATDVLIRVLGLERVNAVAEEMMPGHARITTLADVRRHAYSRFHADAFGLTSQHLLELRREPNEAARITRLARILGVPRDSLLVQDLDAAFDAYYDTQLNAAPLSAYGHMLAALYEGRALGSDGSAYLTALMARIDTGARRIKAGLPAGTAFMHKTGTQHRRACDLGVASRNGRAVVIAACARGERQLAVSERALRQVGAAVAASGVLDPATDTGSAP